MEFALALGLLVFGFSCGLTHEKFLQGNPDAKEFWNELNSDGTLGTKLFYGAIVLIILGILI